MHTRRCLHHRRRRDLSYIRSSTTHVLRPHCHLRPTCIPLSSPGNKMPPSRRSGRIPNEAAEASSASAASYCSSQCGSVHLSAVLCVPVRVCTSVQVCASQRGSVHPGADLYIPVQVCASESVTAPVFWSASIRPATGRRPPRRQSEAPSPTPGLHMYPGGRSAEDCPPRSTEGSER